MIGQSKLKSIINKYIDTNTLPRTLLLEGDFGCGKHTAANYISSLLHIDLEDITKALNLETIERATLSAVPKVYLIDTVNISVKEQNVILKFLEEPLKNSYIILICESKSRLLETVVNRCICLSFQRYSIEELSTFVEDKNIWATDLFYLADTPGRVIQFQTIPLSEMIEFAKKILTQTRVANYSNILTIPNKINFKDDQKLFQFETLVYLLVKESFLLYDQGLVPYQVYQMTDDFYNDTKIPHINKQHLLEHYLIDLKQFYSYLDTI